MNNSFRTAVAAAAVTRAPGARQARSPTRRQIRMSPACAVRSLLRILAEAQCVLLRSVTMAVIAEQRGLSPAS